MQCVWRMKRPAGQRVAVAFASLLSAFASNGHASQGKKSSAIDPAAKPVSNYEDVGYQFSIALDHLAQKYTTPIGLDLEIPVERESVSVRVPRGTVADILNAIIAQEPGYKWAQVNGVLIVMPEVNPNSIVGLQIAHFHVRNADLFGIHTAIVSLPEVKKWLEQNHLTERTAFAFDMLVGKDGYNPPRVSLNLRNVTLRDIMNEIVRRPGFHSWSVGRWGEKNQYFGIAVD